MRKVSNVSRKIWNLPIYIHFEIYITHCWGLLNKKPFPIYMTDKAFYWVDVGTFIWGMLGGWSKGRVDLGGGGALGGEDGGIKWGGMTLGIEGSKKESKQILCNLGKIYGHFSFVYDWEGNENESICPFF